MPILLGALGLLLGIMIWIWRAHYTVRAVQELDQDTKALRRRASLGVEDLFGTRLGRVRDARLAATILMIQLVRTGAPITASEKSTILALLEDPLDVEDPGAMFERAWGYTGYRKFFSSTADELLAFLRRQLTPEERLQLVDMLTRVANAYGEASDLQLEAITRLERRLMSRPSGHEQKPTGTFED